MMTTALRALELLILVSLLTAAGASCEELPSSGSFEGRWTVTGEVERLPFADDREAYVVVHRGTLFLNRPNGLPQALTSRCVGFGESGLRAEGRCSFTDTDGDSIFAELTTVGMTPGVPVTGKLVGGTGRYQKIRGELSSPGWRYGADLPEGETVQAFMDRLTGTWSSE